MAKGKTVDSMEVVAPGKFRAAWSVLRGQRLVPLQVQAEWLTYQQIFDDVLQRLGAQLARQAKAESDRLKRYLRENPEPAQEPQLSLSTGEAAAHKDALRRRFAKHRAPQLVFRSQSSAQPQPDPPEEAP